jgi:diguanylate cyclase (GGDEF)-like protein/putative nucleotidyltransferase with HDIG domain/PAS domain S-box-containing protein
MESYREQACSRAYMEGVARVSASMLGNSDRDGVLAELAEAVVAVFGLEYAGVFLREGAGDELVLVAQAGEPAETRALGFRHQTGDGVIGRAASTGELQLVGEVTGRPEAASHHLSDVWSQLCLPLVVGGRVTGVLDIQSNRPRAFEPDMLPALQALGGLSALAIERARLYRVSSANRQVLSALIDATDSGILMVTPNAKVQAVNQRFCRFFGLERAALMGGDVFEVLEPLASRFDDPEAFRTELGFLAAGADSRRAELGVREPPGCYRVYTGPVTDAGGNLIGRIQAYQDISALRNTQSQLELIAQAGRAINQDLCPEAILKRLADILVARFPIEWMGIMGTDERERPTELVATWSWTDLQGACGCEGVPDGGDLKETAVYDLTAGEVPPRYRALLESGLGAAARIPLLLEGKLVGLWCVAAPAADLFTPSCLKTLESIAGYLAGAMKNAGLYRRADHMYQATIRALAAAVDAKDRYTMNHSANVSRYAGIMARVMGLSAEEVRRIEDAGLVHDLGKVGIPDRILNKPGRLDLAERAVMITHSAAGAGILESAGALRELVPLVRHHHEWYAGGGYPDGLSGDDIPLGAAILAVADALDTMTSYRVYRSAMTLDAALAEIQRCAGHQFHPDVVVALFRAVADARARGDSWVAELEYRERVPAWSSGPPHTLVGDGLPAIMSKELAVLLRIGEGLARLLDLPELLQYILSIVSEEMGSCDVSILLHDPVTGEMTLAASAGALAPDVGRRLPAGAGITGWVMEHGLAQNVPDVNRDLRYHRFSSPGKGSELYVPLDTRGRRLGVLIAGRAETNAFTDGDLRLLTAVAIHIASAIDVAQLHEQVKRAAATDPLTELYNRRHFMRRFEEELARARRHHRELALVLADVDHLKWTNENYGHLAGDEAIAKVARHLRLSTRVTDVVARFGGDEFVILLPETGVAGAEKTMERIVRVWSGQTMDAGERGQIPVPGLSYGVAAYPADGDEPRQIIARADERLFAYKAHNRVVPTASR